MCVCVGGGGGVGGGGVVGGGVGGGGGGHRYDASNCAVCKFTFRKDSRSLDTAELMKHSEIKEKRNKKIMNERKNATSTFGWLVRQDAS